MKTRIAPLAALALSALLLAGCGNGRSASPAPAPSSTSSSHDAGGLVPSLGMNGKVGIGLDLGDGLTLHSDGGLGIGF